MIRSRSIWFFTSSNPTIAFGGFEGEEKKEIYQQFPDFLIPKTIYADPKMSFQEVSDAIQISEISYPFVVKPNVGMKGILFRKIDDEDQLNSYHKMMPADYVIQEWIDLPLEVSVFYYRYPGSDKGKVSGFFAKELLHVVGNGKDDLYTLIRKHPKACYREEELRRKHGHLFDHVLPVGKKYYLSIAGNHNRGARFISLKHEIDDTLYRTFDKLNDLTPHFYYGRYDIKTLSVEDLKAGNNFCILEYNGAGAEPNQIYDCNMRLIDAYREILSHWKVLYEISRYNHENGYPYWTFTQGREFLRRSKAHFKKLALFE